MLANYFYFSANSKFINLTTLALSLAHATRNDSICISVGVTSEAPAANQCHYRDVNARMRYLLPTYVCTQILGINIISITMETPLCVQVTNGGATAQSLDNRG